MTHFELKQKLIDSCLFTDAEVHYISRTCGQYTIGNAIIACQIGNIELTGNDIDVLIDILND